jgi:3-dehydroquinate synthase
MSKNNANATSKQKISFFFVRKINIMILKLKNYDLHIEKINQALVDLEVEKYSQIIILVDENTKRFCLPYLLKYINAQKINIIQIKSGEKNKNLKTCEKIWSKMMDFQADRKALLINLGGGVIGDMGGFCASTFKRGFDFIQIPTTLLSQVDSSVGGKLGIDFKGIKNSIGVFQDPKMVIIDPFFLKTLSKRELKSGFAEMIKHSLIADEKQWKNFQTIGDFDEVDWQTAIEKSVLIKKNIVEKDPFEKNIRKALNFGHTIGHAVESHFLESEKPLLHGEAIAIGMICEAYISCEKNLLPKEKLEKITSFFLKNYEKVNISSEIHGKLIETMLQDKKNETSEINFTLLSDIGTFEINHTANTTLILESIEYYNSL